MRVSRDRVSVEMVDEPTYTAGSSDNVRCYDREILLADRADHIVSKHGIVLSDESQRRSVVLLANGGATAVHDRSLLLRSDHVLAAVCGYVVCLSRPDLAREWVVEVDPATCFGLYEIPGSSDFVSHGELEIARITDSGSVVWSNGGRDIFTGGFELASGRVIATDFENERYEFELTGGSVLVGPM
jgi:hypothetical protein